MAHKPIAQDKVRARNRAAKGFVDHKAEARIKELVAENSQLRMSVLNLRQMFETTTQEKLQLQAAVDNAQMMLTAAVVNGRGKSIRIKKKAIETVHEYEGLQADEVDGDLVLTAVKADPPVVEGPPDTGEE